MDIRTVLSRVTTLSPERKAELITKFESDALTEDDRAELRDHILQAMDIVGKEIDVAKELLAAA